MLVMWNSREPTSREIASSMCARTSLRSKIARSFCSSTVPGGSLGNVLASSSAALPARLSNGRLLRRGGGNEAVEVGQAPGHRDPEAGRRRGVVRVEPGEQMLEALPRVGKLAALQRQLARQDLVVQRGHEHLHAVLGHHADALEQVLLGQLGAGSRARRRR